jgi:uncharacterized damage-inducible protein DinB
MNRQSLLILHDYSVYANNLTLDRAEKLSEEKLARRTSPSRNSVIELLFHMFSTEQFFLAVCQGISTNNEKSSTPILADLRQMWDELVLARKIYLDKTQENLLGVSVFVPIGLNGFSLPRWQLIVQSLVHSIHHRGELSIVMTQLDCPLPTLDPIIHFVNESGQEWPFA